MPLLSGWLWRLSSGRAWCDHRRLAATGTSLQKSWVVDTVLGACHRQPLFHLSSCTFFRCFAPAFWAQSQFDYIQVFWGLVLRKIRWASFYFCIGWAAGCWAAFSNPNNLAVYGEVLNGRAVLQTLNLVTTNTRRFLWACLSLVSEQLGSRFESGNTKIDKPRPLFFAK